jgi:hypothetical protein
MIIMKPQRPTNPTVTHCRRKDGIIMSIEAYDFMMGFHVFLLLVGPCTARYLRPQAIGRVSS